MHPGTANRITAGGFAYDAAGDLTQANNGLPQTFAYDSEGQLTNVNSGADTYTYDAMGQRVRKDVPDDWTEYVSFNGVPVAEKNSDGSWSDYIFANGQRIARADSYDERIHTHATFSASNEYAQWYLPFDGYTIKNGDKLSWRQYQPNGARGGMGLAFSDGTNTNWAAKDQNGMAMNSASTQGAWFGRTVDLSAYAGKTVASSFLVTDVATPAGTWDAYYGDMAIVSTDGTVTPIYNRAGAISLAFQSSAGVSNETGAAERSNTAADAELPGNTTMEQSFSYDPWGNMRQTGTQAFQTGYSGLKSCRRPGSLPLPRR